MEQSAWGCHASMADIDFPLLKIFYRHESFQFFNWFPFFRSPRMIFIIDKNAPKCFKWGFLFQNFPRGPPPANVVSYFHHNSLSCLFLWHILYRYGWSPVWILLYYTSEYTAAGLFFFRKKCISSGTPGGNWKIAIRNWKVLEELYFFPLDVLNMLFKIIN